MAAIELDKLFIRLYHGNDKDEAIAEYLSQFDQSAKGIKHTRAKELLYLGLQALEHQEASDIDLDALRQVIREEMAQTTPHLDQDAISEVVRGAMRDVMSKGEGPDLTLSDVRRVVEAALAQNLDRLQLAEPDEAKAENVEEKNVDDEAKIEKSLERLGESLLH